MPVLTLRHRKQLSKHADDVKYLWVKYPLWIDRATIILVLSAVAVAPSVSGYMIMTMLLGG